MCVYCVCDVHGCDHIPHPVLMKCMPERKCHELCNASSLRAVAVQGDIHSGTKQPFRSRKKILFIKIQY